MPVTDIVRREPFTPLANLRQELDRLFDSTFAPWPFDLSADGGALAVDVSECDGAIIVRASMAGFERGEIDVRLEEGVLSISAEHEEEQETREERYYRRERRRGALSRRIALPGVAAGAKVDAKIKNGVLTVTIPLPERAQAKHIEIKAG